MWEELLHVDFLWRIQNLGQDVFGEDSWEKQWSYGVSARGTVSFIAIQVWRFSVHFG